jgi:hypothetical protein
MMTIWKFVLTLDDASNLLTLPKGAIVLTAQLQGEHICLWVMLDPDEKVTEDRQFVVRCTGVAWARPGRPKYIATVQKPPFVWHVFEAKSRWDEY